MTFLLVTYLRAQLKKGGFPHVPFWSVACRLHTPDIPGSLHPEWGFPEFHLLVLPCVGTTRHGVSNSSGRLGQSEFPCGGGKIGSPVPGPGQQHGHLHLTGAASRFFLGGGGGGRTKAAFLLGARHRGPSPRSTKQDVPMGDCVFGASGGKADVLQGVINLMHPRQPMLSRRREMQILCPGLPSAPVLATGRQSVLPHVGSRNRSAGPTKSSLLSFDTNYPIPCEQSLYLARWNCADAGSQANPRRIPAAFRLNMQWPSRVVSGDSPVRARPLRVESGCVAQRAAGSAQCSTRGGNGQEKPRSADFAAVCSPASLEWHPDKVASRRFFFCDSMLFASASSFSSGLVDMRRFDPFGVDSYARFRRPWFWHPCLKLPC